MILLSPSKNIKKAAIKRIKIESEPETEIGKDVLRMSRNTRKKVGKAYANCGNVKPKMIFSLCCNGGGMSYAIEYECKYSIL